MKTFKRFAGFILAFVMSSMITFTPTTAHAVTPNATTARFHLTNTEAGDGMFLWGDQQFVVLSNIPAAHTTIRFTLDGRTYDMNRTTDGRAWFIPHANTQRNIALPLTIRPLAGSDMDIWAQLYIRILNNGHVEIMTPAWFASNREIINANNWQDADSLWNFRQPTDASPQTQAIIDQAQAIRDTLPWNATNYQITRAVHEWVATNIRRDLDRAPTVANQRADNVLFSWRAPGAGHANVAISLLHSLGIPARRVEGTAFPEYVTQWHPSHTVRTGSFYDHAWVEAHVNGRWITMDPMWDSHREFRGGQWLSAQYLPGLSNRLAFFDITHELLSINRTITGYTGTITAIPPIGELPPGEQLPDLSIAYANRTFRIDGSVYAFWDTWTRDGVEYVWIRDIAYTLSFVGRDFAIDWDGANTRTLVTTTRRYVPQQHPNHGYMFHLGATRAAEQDTRFGTSQIVIDGTARNFNTIMVNGRMAVPLAEFGTATGLYTVNFTNRTITTTRR